MSALARDDAERLTTAIQSRLGTIADDVEAVVPMIEQARNGDAHRALGYPSWTKYVAEKFGGSLSRLGKAERLPFVELMAEQGMSTRAIASVVGTSHQTVANDLAGTPVKNLTPAGAAKESACPTCRVSVHLPNPTCGNSAHDGGGMLGDAPSGEHTRRRTTTGNDGKTYTRPQPKESRRPSFPDSYQRAVWELDKAVRRIEGLHADDRFNGYRGELKPYGGLLSDIASAVSDVESDVFSGNKCSECGKRRLPSRGYELVCGECRLAAT